ncbi:hypothetical protein BaRGS_00002263 [Batillaria attramentaria]|uniref:Uncharacterized protein n=1 Tax=Batillaria attramentaria TaxID=370345 RepID=A0ABD0M5P4_9CAEN
MKSGRPSTGVSLIGDCGSEDLRDLLSTARLHDKSDTPFRIFGEVFFDCRKSKCMALRLLGGVGIFQMVAPSADSYCVEICKWFALNGATLRNV